MKQSLDNFGLLLHLAARGMRKSFDRRAADLGLSSAQWRLLINVSRLGHSTQARLADVLEIEPISVSRLVDRMETAGWVQREADPADRRAKRVVPTAKALAIYAEMKLKATDVYTDALQGVSEADRAILIKSLTTILTNLSAGDCDPNLSMSEAKK